MELNIDKVLELYNRRVAELEHEVILLRAQIDQLQEEQKKEE